MASEDVQTNLRIPADLKDRLVASASENNRSLSAEVASRLEGSYTPGETYATKAQLDRVFHRISEEHNNTLMAVATVRDLLSAFVVRLYDRLPARDKQSPDFLMMKSFAESVKSTDEGAAKQAFRKVFEGTADLAGSSIEKEQSVAEYFASQNQHVTAIHRQLLKLDEDPLQPVKPSP